MATLQSLLSEYDIKRNMREQRAQRKRLELMEAIPQLKALFSKKDAILFENMRSALRGGCGDIRPEVDAVNTQIDLLLARHGLDQSAFLPHYDCKKCADTGYVNKDGRREFCTCLTQKIYTEIYHAEDISKLNGCFRAFDEQLFSDDGKLSPRKRINRIKKLCMDYVQAYPALKKPNFIFTGNTGLGKTFMMDCIAGELNRKAENILYISAFELIRVFHKNRLGELDFISPIFDAPLLLIDDLGTEPMTQNVTVEYLFQLFDTRIKNHLPMVIATNLSPAELMKRYGERISSRLLAQESSSVLMFKGEDIRLNKSGV